MTLILCGMACCGKTTLGKEAATRLGVPFVDTDALLVEQCGKCMQEIARTLPFRILEKEVITALEPTEGILAVGGGAPLLEENRIHLKRLGCVIYLKTPLHLLFERLKNRPFPTLLDPGDPYGSLAQLLKERAPLYEAYADRVVETAELTKERLISTLCETYEYLRTPF